MVGVRLAELLTASPVPRTHITTTGGRGTCLLAHGVRSVGRRVVPQMCWLVYAASGVVCRWAWEWDGLGPGRGGRRDRVYEEGGGKLLSLSCLILLFSGLWSSPSGFVNHLGGCVAGWMWNWPAFCPGCQTYTFVLPGSLSVLRSTHSRVYVWAFTLHGTASLVCAPVVPKLQQDALLPYPRGHDPGAW